MNYIEYFKKRKLLSSGKANTKTAKNEYETYYLSLQPTDLNSKKENLCAFSTKECRTQCLQYAGRQGFSNVVQSRSNKTEYFINNRKEFLTQLWGELKDLNDSKRKIAIRLNLLSDVNWELQFEEIGKRMSELKNIQFYDYTKDHFKVNLNGLKNYHLTYSYSGYNWDKSEIFLKTKRANVAMVFKNDVPLLYKGYKVINGDESDERYLDKKGVIVGLKYKKPKGVDYKPNKFVIE